MPPAPVNQILCSSPPPIPPHLLVATAADTPHKHGRCKNMRLTSAFLCVGYAGVCVQAAAPRSCRPSNYAEVEQCRANSTSRIIVAAACHSKDTGGFAPVGAETYLDVSGLRQWRLDTNKMRLTVGAGVMYLDVASALGAANLALPAYGNYGGQTIVGAMSTSTHGAGRPSLANFVTRMHIIDARGRRRDITRSDHDFPAWANSLGALGVVVEAVFELTHNWNVLETTLINIPQMGLVPLLQAHPLSYAFHAPAPANGRRRSTDPPCHSCFFAWRRVETSLRVNATYPKESYMRGSIHMGGVGRPRAYAFNDLVHWERRKKQMPCYERVAKQGAWLGPVGNLQSELELMIRPDQLMAVIDALAPIRYGSSSTRIVVEFRYVLRDTQDVLLSPYRDGDRIAMSIPSVKRADGDRVVKLLARAGVDIRFHRGKGAPRELVEASTWDSGAARAFERAKQANDPSALFGSAYVDLLPFCKALASSTGGVRRTISGMQPDAIAPVIVPTTALPAGASKSVNVAMPMLAFGPQSHQPDFVARALQLGLRHLDSSYHYGEGVSQRRIGAGIARFGRREDVFLTTKINGCGCAGGGCRYHAIRSEACFKDTLHAVQESLKELRTAFIDLLLLHHPPTCGQGGTVAGHTVDCSLPSTCLLVRTQWRALEQSVRQGFANHIGVSNYCPRCVDCLLRTATKVPAVAQLMVNVGAPTPIDTLMSWSERLNLRIMAYSPINGLGLSRSQRAEVTRIGAEHGNKSFVQVALRWLTQHGVTPIVSSRSLGHLQQNLDHFRWQLSDRAMRKLDGMRGTMATRGPSQDCIWEEAPTARRLLERGLLTASTSTSRHLVTYDEYALKNLSVVDFIKSMMTNQEHAKDFTALEIGIGEGRAVLELQQLVPEAIIVGINKPMPMYRWRTSIAQNEEDLRVSAKQNGMVFRRGARMLRILLSNATDKVLMDRPSSSTHRPWRGT